MENNYFFHDIHYIYTESCFLKLYENSSWLDSDKKMFLSYSSVIVSEFSVSAAVT